MDIEKMMRVNALSKELQKHNFATSSQEGLALAESTLARRSVVNQPQSSFSSHQVAIPTATVQFQPAAPLAPPKQQAQSSVPFGEPQLQKQEQAPQQEANPFLLNKKIEILVKKNNVQLQQELSNVKSLVSSLSEEVKKLRTELKDSQDKNTIVLKSQQEQSQVETPVKKVEKQSTFHPKQGNVQPNEVSIEKMFYFGRK